MADIQIEERSSHRSWPWVVLLLLVLLVLAWWLWAGGYGTTSDATPTSDTLDVTASAIDGALTQWRAIAA